MEETVGSSVWATLITAREKTLARDKRGVVGDQDVLVPAGLRGLLGPLGTGDVGSGSGDRRAWGTAGGTGPPGVLGGVCGNAGEAVSQEGAVEMRGQVCMEPAERGASGVAPGPMSPLHPLPRQLQAPHWQGTSQGTAAAQAVVGSPGGMDMPGPARVGTCGGAHQRRLQLMRWGCQQLCRADKVILQRGAAQRWQDGGLD